MKNKLINYYHTLLKLLDRKLTKSLERELIQLKKYQEEIEFKIERTQDDLNKIKLYGE